MAGAPGFADHRLDDRTRGGVAAEVLEEASDIGGAVREVIAGEAPTDLVASATVTTITTLLQAAYDALDPADGGTLYIVTDSPAVYFGATAVVAPPA